MKERLFDVKKLAGIIGLRLPEDRKPLLYKLIKRANGVREMQTSKGWPTFKEILEDYRAGIALELGNKLLSDAQLHRLNHRMELMNELNEEFDRVLREGDAAAKELEKLNAKEKRNG